MSVASFCLLTILIHAPFAGAEPGPNPRGMPLPPAMIAKMNRSDVEAVLLAELSSVFHGGAAPEHISRLEAQLNGMYNAVPKNSRGFPGHAVVRYMLHRFFVEQHGWYIRGLEPGNTSALQKMLGKAQDSLVNTTAQNLQEWVPSYLQKFLEETQGGRGISLRELAVLAASLEDLIHKESNQRLQMTFTALEHPLNTTLDEDQLRQTLEVYMMIYMTGGNFTQKGHSDILRAHRIFTEFIKGWDKVQQWLHSVQVEVAPSSIEKPLDYTDASRVVEEVGRRYGRYNDEECGNLKSDILQIESTKAGRVRLSDFYKRGLSGFFEFKETIEYLRALGTIDDSNSSEPYVIIPNYVASRPNCLSVSSFYVVCCRNECEDLFATVELKFEKPMANPEQILELVASFSTKTVEGPRTLSDNLVRRLNSIADANEGEVPLHGRLFAQWMHHAFPRECPYPVQQAGGVAPMTADEWIEATGHKSAHKTSEEIQQFVVNSDSSVLPVGEQARQHQQLPENELPWDEEEELLHPRRRLSKNVVTLERVPSNAPWDVADEILHPRRSSSTDEDAGRNSAEDVVTLFSLPIPPKASKRSLMDTAAPMAAIASFFLSMSALAWKMRQQVTQHEKKAVDCAMV